MAAASNDGGLGILASANYKTKKEFSDAIDEIHNQTDKPFAVNINLFPSLRVVDNNEFTDVLIEKGEKIVETSGQSAPEDLYKPWKDAGTKKIREDEDGNEIIGWKFRPLSDG